MPHDLLVAIALAYGVVQPIERLNPVERACAILGIRVSKLYQLLRAGKLTGVYIGHKRQITGESIERFIASLTDKPPDNPPPKPPRKGERPRLRARP